MAPSPRSTPGPGGGAGGSPSRRARGAATRPRAFDRLWAGWIAGPGRTGLDGVGRRRVPAGRGGCPARHRCARTACLGGSFGGYMTNWVAGHTDRFRLVPTPGFGRSTNSTRPPTGRRGRPGCLAPRRNIRNGTPRTRPHLVDRITPRCWSFTASATTGCRTGRGCGRFWDLVSRHAGDPAELPHRFLEFTGENHWILSPHNARICTRRCSPSWTGMFSVGRGPRRGSPSPKRPSALSIICHSRSRALPAPPPHADRDGYWVNGRLTT